MPFKSRGIEPASDPSIVIGAKEVANMLGISVKTAQKRMRDGEIHGYREGRVWRAYRHSVRDYVDRRMKSAEKQVEELRKIQDSNTRTIDMLCRVLGAKRVL